jgi:hypothetical protein
MSSSVQFAHEATIVLAAGDGLIDWGSTKVNELGDLFRAASVVAGIGFVIYQAIASRGAMARVIISGLSAAVFVWIVWNVTDLRKRVDDEVDGAPAVQPHQPAAPPDRADLTDLHGTA